MQREAKTHETFGTVPMPPPPPRAESGGVASSKAGGAGEAGGGDGGEEAFGGMFGNSTACGECEPDSASAFAEAAGSAGVGVGGLGGGAAGKASATNWTRTPEQRAGATQAGFRASDETTHGMTTEQLRQKLSEAGIGVRAATAADFGMPGLW